MTSKPSQQWGKGEEEESCHGQRKDGESIFRPHPGAAAATALLVKPDPREVLSREGEEGRGGGGGGGVSDGLCFSLVIRRPTVRTSIATTLTTHLATY